jgi:hypothetical protein
MDGQISPLPVGFSFYYGSPIREMNGVQGCNPCVGAVPLYPQFISYLGSL